MNLSIIGKMLRGVRAGDRNLACNSEALRTAPATIQLTSESFSNGGAMPKWSAGEGVGDNISPQLAWHGVPPDAREVILIVQDPDAPLPRPVVHLIAYGIDPQRTSFAKGALAQPSADFTLGRGTFGKPGYQGPRPVPGHGAHRYIFQLVASKAALAFAAPPKLDAVVAALNGRVLAWGQLVGLFER